ncbi:hypothetical protein PML80_08290 [Aerococcus urinaeequi]|uniref:Uncharacterized protein n=1 Tax=Aerococcus urinaeequi TaxID=51665 RepID=A0AAE9XLK4_9LACT|nr:hypothetical protein [Aerococcus urinaeequi]WCG37506.1 hypothetical protein PML80_08290 [Aerococcus urinaeequi]
MNFKKSLIIGASVLTLAPIASATFVSGSVYAEESPTTYVEPSSDETSTSAEYLEISNSEILKIDPYVMVQDNQYTLSSEAHQYLSDSEIEKANAYIDMSNQEVKANDVKLNSETKSGVVEETSTAFRSSAAGKNDIEFHWWGARIYLDSHHAEALKEAAIAGGSTGLGGLMGGTAGASAGAAIGAYLSSIASNYPITKGIKADYNFFTKQLSHFAWQ